MLTRIFISLTFVRIVEFKNLTPKSTAFCKEQSRTGDWQGQGNGGVGNITKAADKQ